MMEWDGVQDTSEDTRKRMRYIVPRCWHHGTSNTRKRFCDAISASKQLWSHIVPMKNQLEKAEEHWT